MQEKIDLFTRGVFSYEKPELVISTDNITISVEAGKVFRGSFCVSAEGQVPVRGKVYSSSGLLTIDEPEFSGVENTINYSFDARYLDHNDQNLDRNDRLKGRVTILSEFGEAYVPFHAVIKPAICDTSVGPASDLFHFASLAQTNWAEAKELFKSEEFRRIFTASDPRYDNICRILQRSEDTSLALEEFLVTTHKKKSVCITADKTSLNYDSLGQAIEDSIIIKKDSWGYVKLNIDTVGDFIVPEVRTVYAEDFTGNIYELVFSIDTKRLHPGTNYGALRITTVRDTIEVAIVVRNPVSELKAMLSRRRMKHYVTRLFTSFLEYRMGHVNVTRFVADEETTLDSLKAFGAETLESRLFRIYLMILAGRTGNAAAELSVIEEDEDWQGREPFLYAVVLGLRAKLDNDSFTVSETISRLREMYEHDGDPRIFVLCIALDKRKRLGNNTRYEELKRSFHGDPIAWPVLLDAALTANEEPTVFKEFAGFDLQVINFGLKYNVLSKNAVLQAAYLAGRCHTTDPMSVRVIKRAFDRFKVNEVLEPMCMHLVLEGRNDRSTYRWLSIGVTEQLRVRDLCETCLNMAGDALELPLPKPLFTYFENSSELSVEQKTALYANALLFNTATDSISPKLMKDITDFARQMLAQGHMSKGMAVIYNAVLTPDMIDNELIRQLPNVVFKHLAKVDWPHAESLLVVHKELENESIYPIVNGEALIDIFTGEPAIFVIDDKGDRISTAEVETQKLLNSQDIMQMCVEQCGDDDRVALYSLENMRYRGLGDDTIEMVRRCAGIASLEKGFALACYKELIEYYYESLEGDIMESYLVKVDLSGLDRSSRSRMIDLMILRELYTLAMTNLDIYGITGVDVKRLAKLATVLIENQSTQVEAARFMDTCVLVFRKKRHTEQILEFLVSKYEGDTETMYEIWNSARETDIDTVPIEERLIRTLLYTESDMSYACDVFKHYYGHISPNSLIRAFLSYCAYGYLAYDRIPDDEMLMLMQREATYEENDVCMLAVLKYLAGKPTYTEPEIRFISKQLDNMERKGIRMPFFKDFPRQIRVSGSMQDRCYVEYHTDSRKRVRIHYCMVADGPGASYTVEDMKDTGYGIFVKEFVLFYGEVLQYYISEEYNGVSAITEASEIEQTSEIIGADDNKYHQLNLMITAREMNDSKTMYKLMESYIKTDYLCKRLFRPI